MDMINLLWIRFGLQINDVRKPRKKLQKLKADAEDLSNRKSGLTEERRDNVGKMASKHVRVEIIRRRRLKMRSVRLKTSTNKIRNASLFYVLILYHIEGWASV